MLEVWNRLILDLQHVCQLCSDKIHHVQSVWMLFPEIDRADRVSSSLTWEHHGPDSCTEGRSQHASEDGP
jgi:hypothetical protein